MQIVIDSKGESMVVAVDYGERGAYKFYLDLPQALWNVQPCFDTQGEWRIG